MKKVSLILGLFFALAMQAQVYQLSQVDNAPVFANGKMSSSEFMRYYLKYPQSEFDKGIEGTVMLSFLVDSTGMVLNPKVERSLSPALDQEALRVASLIPFYKPATKNGRSVTVNTQFPVKFQLDKGKVVPDAEPVSSTVQNSDEPKNPLYVVDGKILDSNSDLNPDNIKTIRVIKGKKAIELYGNRAKDGVISIKTK